MKLRSFVKRHPAKSLVVVVAILAMVVGILGFIQVTVGLLLSTMVLLGVRADDQLDENIELQDEREKTRKTLYATQIWLAEFILREKGLDHLQLRVNWQGKITVPVLSDGFPEILVLRVDVSQATGDLVTVMPDGKEMPIEKLHILKP